MCRRGGVFKKDVKTKFIKKNLTLVIGKEPFDKIISGKLILDFRR